MCQRLSTKEIAKTEGNPTRVYKQADKTPYVHTITSPQGRALAGPFVTHTFILDAPQNWGGQPCQLIAFIQRNNTTSCIFMAQVVLPGGAGPLSYTPTLSWGLRDEGL